MKLHPVCILLALTGLALCASADTLIDDFSTAQGPVEGDSWASGSGILGGTRYIHYDGTESNSVESTSGSLDFVYGDISRGDYITLTYDGGTGDITPDYTGLGGVNLGGTDGFFRFSFNASVNISLWIYAWTDEEHASATDAIVVGDSATPFTLDVQYSDFNTFGALGAADFSNIGAFRVEALPYADPANFASMNLDEIQAVPEPASALLMLSTVLVGYFIRRRFID